MRCVLSSNANSFAEQKFLHSAKYFFLLLLLAGMFATSLSAEQTDISHYDIYTGFTDLNSPALGLNQMGFHTQAGWNPRTWYSLGVDYSVASGSEVLKPDLLPTALQQQLGGVVLGFIQAGAIPPTYQLAIPVHVMTQSFAIGPQFPYRHFQNVTLFLRPSFGAFRLAATPHPTDLVSTTIAGALAPSGHKVDWTSFYGVGGGDEIRLTRYIGLRTQMDLVYNHPFNDILANGFWTMRYSGGLMFHFGSNIASSRKK